MSPAALLLRSTSSRLALASACVSCRTRGSTHVCHAKKGGKGGKGKGGNKKGGSLLGNIPAKAVPPPWMSTEVIMQHFLMVESYWRLVGTPLLPDAEIEDIASVVWEAPFAILAHNRGSHAEGADVVFTYANKLALEVFEAEWDDLVGKPSTNSVSGADAQADREQLLSTTESAEAGFTSGYTGTRQTAKGRAFELHDGTLWNILSPTGKMVGQAVRFDTVKYGDGPLVKLGQQEAATSAPLEADVTAQEAAVEEQAALVRALKQDQGLTNKDSQVVEAVAELLARKEALAAMQAALETARSEQNVVADA